MKAFVQPLYGSFGRVDACFSQILETPQLIKFSFVAANKLESRQLPSENLSCVKFMTFKDLYI